MKVSEIQINSFRKFSNLTITDLPDSSKLVVLAGPNGTGKSSLFDAFLIHYRYHTGYGYNDDAKYYRRTQDRVSQFHEDITILTHENKKITRGSIYIRTAYRNEAEFSTNSLSRQGAILDNLHLLRLIDTDSTVSNNYTRLASQAMEDLFGEKNKSTTLGEYREQIIGEIQKSLSNVFPELTLLGLGNPLEQGSFHFKKGSTHSFDYKNLSGGEKAAFDLILDIIVKRRSYADAIYCIDEPETHMNTRVQGKLLDELLAIIPENSQLWISSHSIGMMRRAREIYEKSPELVSFLDFGDKNFDEQTIITPSLPTRNFWQNILHVALDDLATLVAPQQVVICEGNPATPIGGKNVEYDAKIYSTIFAQEFPDTTFISAGSSNQVSGDFLALATALPKIATGMKITRLIDLDDHSPEETDSLKKQSINVLSRRHIECYLFDDEILSALCREFSQEEKVTEILEAKNNALRESIGRGNPVDDVKSAAGKIYTESKKILNLTQVGNDRHTFAKEILAKLITPDTNTYQELKKHIFEK